MMRIEPIMKKILLCCLLLISATARSELNLELPELSLPNVSTSTGTTYIATKEQQTGLKILRQLRSSNQIIEDSEINNWIRSIGNRLSARAPSISAPFYFLVSKDEAINAFATMGGVIVVNAGLIASTQSESELAAVLSHEIAHITQRHIQRMLEKAKNNKLATNAALLAGILASTKDPQAGQAIINTTIATMIHKQLSFSREAEAEADRVGQRILASAGFDPKGMPQFLRKLKQFDDDKYAGVMEYLQNHPLTSKRVTDTQIRAHRLPRFNGKNNTNYLYMREKVRAYLKHTSLPVTDLPAPIKQYAQATHYQKRRSYSQALSLLGRTTNSNYHAALLKAELLNKLRSYQKTINLLKPLTRIYPDDETLAMPLAQAYLGIGRPQDAWNLLKNITTSEQTSLDFFDLLKESARLAGKPSQAYLAAAQRNIRIGHYSAASIQLRQAMRLPGTTVYELPRIQKLLDEISQDSLSKNQ